MRLSEKLAALSCVAVAIALLSVVATAQQSAPAAPKAPAPLYNTV